MTNSHDSINAQKSFINALDIAAARGLKLRWWWRDDDATHPCNALDVLLKIALDHDIPVALAVIPAAATPSLAAWMAAAPATLRIFQHGFQHHNHAVAPMRKNEFPDTRPATAIAADLTTGRARLEQLFGTRFLPVLTPPWNRLGAQARNHAIAAGLSGLSLYGRLQNPPRHQCNTHLDLIDWRQGRCFIGTATAYQNLYNLIIERINAIPVGIPCEPIGILSHHQVDFAACSAFLNHLFGVLRQHHDNHRWKPLADLFEIG